MDDELRRLRAEVRLLVAKQCIRPIPGVDDLSKETLQDLIEEYKVSKLKSVNLTITQGLVRGITLLCKHSNIIPEETVSHVETELLDNEVFMTESTNLVGQLTPHIPMIGLTVGVIILGKYIIDGICAVRRAVHVDDDDDDEEEE